MKSLDSSPVGRLLAAAALVAAGACGTHTAWCQAAVRDMSVETSPGVRLHLQVAGSANSKPALILIPGWRLTASIWQEQLLKFSTERQVMALDPRSQGDSTVTAEGDTPEQRAKDINAVLHKLQVGRSVLVGWSQGVQDVAAYIDQFGTQSLAGVVLVDSTVSRGANAIVEAPQFAARQLGLFSLYATDPEEYTRGMMRAIIKRPLSGAELGLLVSGALKTPTAIGEAMLVADLFGVDRTSVLAKIDRPTLVIASALSQELEAQKKMAGGIPGSRFEVIQDAGHAVFVDQPERFDGLVTDFLAGLARG